MDAILVPRGETMWEILFGVGYFIAILLMIVGVVRYIYHDFISSAGGLANFDGFRGIAIFVVGVALFFIIMFIKHIWKRGK